MIFSSFRVLLHCSGHGSFPQTWARNSISFNPASLTKPSSWATPLADEFRLLLSCVCSRPPSPHPFTPPLDIHTYRLGPRLITARQETTPGFSRIAPSDPSPRPVVDIASFCEPLTVAKAIAQVCAISRIWCSASSICCYWLGPAYRYPKGPGKGLCIAQKANKMGEDNVENNTPPRGIAGRIRDR